MKMFSSFDRIKHIKRERRNKMSIEVYMPRLGATMKDGTLTRWLKREGDSVQKGESIAEITSEKLTNELEAPEDGFLDKIIIQEGETVPVATVIAVISSEAKGSLEPKPGQEEEIRNKDNLGSKIVLEEKPLSSLRKIIGERMAESLLHSPQGTMTTRADMTELIALKDELAATGKKVTYTDIFVKIVGLALEKNPLLNSSIEDGKLILYKSINIGVGVGIEDGLLVPVIKNVQQKNLLQISQELKELAVKVKEKRITTDEMTGGTFTISNLGMFDVDIITPIINPPEAAILAIGATRKEAIVLDDDIIVVKPVTTLSLTADHAVMDGIPAVTFLSTVKDIMKNPHEFLN
jgi:pyruvate dehydrogenase E2 component (dihydrolipoamide acetyltransferase)